MTKLFSSKIFWTIAIIVIVGAGGAYFYISQDSGPEYVTEAVVRQDLLQTVSATGQVKSASEVNLNFKNTGRINEINVEVGDEVLADQVISRQRSTNLQIDINRARADLLEAQANLDKVRAGATSQEIRIAEVAVDTAESSLESAKIDLVNTQKTYNQALTNAKQDLLVDINAALTKSAIALGYVDDTLNYEGDANNFITSDIGLEVQVGNKYITALSAVDAADASYDAAVLNATDVNLENAGDDILVALLSVEDALDDLRVLLDKVLTNAILSEADLDGLKTTINTQRTTIDASVDTVQLSIQDIDDAQIDLETKVAAAEKAIVTAENRLVQAEADLELKRAPARDEDVALYQARVTRALASLQSAEDALEDTILRAPFDGVITEVNYDVGEQSSASTPVVMLVVKESLEIEVDIPESDIAKLENGDEAAITLDAFSEDEVFSGRVLTIDPAQTEIQDVIYYRVTVNFSAEQPENVADFISVIKPGMTANIDIQTARKDQVLVIPFRAIREENGQRIVQVLEGDSVRDVSVSTGLRGDDGLVEITSGLEAGQSVVTFTRTN